MTTHTTSTPQLARAVMMIRPARFLANPQTQASNAFQKRDLALDAEAQQARALAEFDGLASALRDAGVEVCVFEDTPEPHTPDSIFPNNWVSFHADGRVVFYPMLAENRRDERRPELVDRLVAEHGFRAGERIDLSGHEAEGRFLEGTGSMVLDRRHGVAYACVSPRTDPTVLAAFGARLGYDVVAFDAFGADGTAIYHTNVLMSVGDGFAVICAEAIPEAQRDTVLARLAADGLEVVAITLDQMATFAGNMLALENAHGRQVLAMSGRAYACLTPVQCEALSRHATLVHASIDAIEDSAGGSVRCMLAEVFLPKG